MQHCGSMVLCTLPRPSHVAIRTDPLVVPFRDIRNEGRGASKGRSVSNRAQWQVVRRLSKLMSTLQLAEPGDHEAKR